MSSMALPDAPPGVLPVIPAERPPSSSFWNTFNVHNRINELRNTLNFARAIQKELEVLSALGEVGVCFKAQVKSSESCEFAKIMNHSWMNWEGREPVSVEAAASLMVKLRSQLEPFRYIQGENTPWEEKSAFHRLRDRLCKSEKKKRWRRRKRKHIDEMHAREGDMFEEADRVADEWRAREIAEDIASRKVEMLKDVSRVKEQEERVKLEAELEMVLVVEKLQELRSIRIEKLKKQGRFLPEEDDVFVDRVRAAVDAEEQQAKAATATDPAREVIAAACIEESRDVLVFDPVRIQKTEVSATGTGDRGQIIESNDSRTDLPPDLHRYYYGSNTDTGALIEVRRVWDAYMRPGGSRIPGHLVGPSFPSSEIWASYVVGHE